MIPRKGLQTQEETPRQQGDTSGIIVFDVSYRPVFAESLPESGISSGELGTWALICRGSLEPIAHLALPLRGLAEHRFLVAFKVRANSDGRY